MSEELKPLTVNAGFDIEEPNAKAIFVFVAALVMMFVLVVIGVQQYYAYLRAEQEHESIEVPPSEQLRELRAREDWELTHYRRLDKAKGVVQLPVERAMELLIKEQAQMNANGHR